MKQQTKAYIYAFSAILFWSTVATAFKLTLKHIDFIQLLFFSSFFSTVVLFLIVIGTGNFKSLYKLNFQQIFQSMLLGFLNPFLYYFILFKAYSLLPAQEAQTLNYAWPIVLVLLSVPLLKQRLTLKTLIAFLISFSGVVVIATHGNIFTLDFSNSTGVLLALSSTIVWSFYWILNMKDKRTDSIKLFSNFCFGTIYSIIALLLFNRGLNVNHLAIAGCFYIGTFEMGITFVLWLKALNTAEKTSDISKFVFLSPFLSLVFIYFILNEQIFISTIIGLVLIISGIFLNYRKKKIEC